MGQLSALQQFGSQEQLAALQTTAQKCQQPGLPYSEVLAQAAHECRQLDDGLDDLERNIPRLTKSQAYTGIAFLTPLYPFIRGNSNSLRPAFWSQQ